MHDLIVLHPVKGCVQKINMVLKKARPRLTAGCGGACTAFVHRGRQNMFFVATLN